MGSLIDRNTGEARESTLIMCSGVGAQVGYGSKGGGRLHRPAECPVCGKKVATSTEGRIRPHGTRRKVQEAGQSRTYSLDFGKRQWTEITCSEYDTADPESSDPQHLALAEAMDHSTQVGKDKTRIQVTQEILVYLAENIHYHIDRAEDQLHGLNPNYDWESWSDAGANLAALRGLDTKVKNMLRKMGVPWKVWTMNGMVYPKAN